MAESKIRYTFALGEMAEWSIAAVLKTVEPRGSGGSNPSLSAESLRQKATEDRQTVQIERFERFFYVVMADKKDRKKTNKVSLYFPNRTP